MNRSLCSALVMFAAVSLAPRARAESLPAFPGAQGWGADTPGGRGGQVIRVTNLNASGPGSLQWAVSQEGPRVVVFDVSGVIESDVTIEHGRLTILGQTAPGAGITIRGMLMSRYGPDIRHEDIVVRFLRVRPDPVLQGHNGDALQFSRVDRLVLDHISCSWATDETIDVYRANDVTVQWCTVEESDPEGEQHQNYGLIHKGERISLHHNLFANHKRRCPAISHGPADIRNNVVYNFRDGLSHEGEKPNNLGFNIVGNYYMAGPSDPDIFPFNFWGPEKILYYLRDNYIVDRPGGYEGMIQDPWKERDKLEGFGYYADRGERAECEFEVPPVVTHSPKRAYELVLARAGCFPRDTVTRRTVREVIEDTGRWERRAPSELMAGLEPAPARKDSDCDGMPDEWERAHGLDPSNGSDHSTVMGSGYTAIEEYANGLAEKLVPGAGD